MARKGYRITGTHFGGMAIFAIAILVFAWWFGAFNFLGVTPPVQPAVPTALVSVNKPVQFSVMDEIAGSALGAMTINVYDGTQLLESLTTAETGLVTSSQPYASGRLLNVQIVGNTTHCYKWTVVTVPEMSAADAQSLTTNYVLLNGRTLGTFAIRIFNDSNGTSLTTTGVVNMSGYSSTPLQLTVTLANSVDNTGYVSSYDPLNRINLDAVVLTSSATSYMTIQNAGVYAPRGTVSNWLKVQNDDLITKHLVGGVYLKPGSQSYTVTIYSGSLPDGASGANQTVTFNLYKNFDTTYFAAQGIGGPNAAAIGSATFSLEFSD